MMAYRTSHARVFVGEGEDRFQLLDTESRAVRAISRLPRCAEDSEVWQAAREVDRAHAEMQIRSDGLSALAWGAVTAFVRQLVR